LQGDVWGVKGIPTEADYTYITKLKGDPLTDLDAFLNSLTTDVSELIITVDVWLRYSSVEGVSWNKDPKIDLLLSDKTNEYLFSAILAQQNDVWQNGIQLSYIDSWTDPNIFTDLSVEIHTSRIFPDPPNSLGYGLDIKIDNLNIAPVPEPATLLLFGSGIIGLAGFRRKLRKK
jgi:hypothetical protein